MTVTAGGLVRLVPWVLIVACAGLLALPLLSHGPSCGHDFDFHLQSWFAARASWRGAGMLWPHWVAGANYGAGEPRFVFYPPLSWMLGAELGGWLPWGAVPAAVTFLAFAGCGVTFFWLARQWVRAPIAAGAACVYAGNPYLLFVAYERTAYGELLGAVAMPLVVLYALRARPAVVRLAVVVAALWLTNAPAAVMGCYLLGLCGLAAAVAERRLAPAGRSLVALVLGTGAAAVYVLPAWYEQRWVEIDRAVGSGMRVQDSFLFGRTGEAFHDQVLHTASLISVGVVGAGLLAVIALGVLRRKSEGSEGRVLLEKVVVATAGSGLLGIGFLLMRWSDRVWRIAPELHFLQFPWRWLLVAGLMAALAAAMAADRVAGRWVNGLGAGVLAAVLCLGAWAAGQGAERGFGQVCDEEDNVQAQQQLRSAEEAGAGADLPGFEGSDEYTAAGAENGEIQQGLPAVRLLAEPGDDEGDDSGADNPDWRTGASAASGRERGGTVGTVVVEEWRPEHKRVTVTTAAPGFAVLRLMDYPAWEVRVDGQVVARRVHREDGLLTVAAPAGTTRIEVAYRATPDVYAGRGISLVCMGVLVGLGVQKKRRETVRA